jgi:WD40 repeat protein
MSAIRMGRRSIVRGLGAFASLWAGGQVWCALSEAWGSPMSSSVGGESAPQQIRRLRLNAYVNAVAWDTDASHLAALSNFGGTITVWETKTWTVATEFHRYGGAYSFNSFAYLPDGTLLTSTPIGNSPDPRYPTLAIFSLIQWNPETGEPIRYIPDVGYPPKELPSNIGHTDTFVVSEDGSLIAGISGRDVLLFETRRWSLIKRIATPPTPSHPDVAESIAFSPDGRQLAVGTLFGSLHFINIQDGSFRLSLVAFPGGAGFGCGALAFSPDGRFLATSRGTITVGQRDDGWTRVWRASDGAMVAPLIGGAGSVRKASWSPSGNVLAIGDDHSVMFWHTDRLPEAPKLIAQVRHDCLSVAFSRRDTLAASDANEIAIYQ